VSRIIHTHNVTTYAHRDYSNNGAPLIVSRSEAKTTIDKFNRLYKAGKITASQRATFTDLMADRVVPL
jgi:hypothetical protein